MSNYFEDLAKKFANGDEIEQSEFELYYYPVTVELALKFNEARKSEERFSSAARCAYDYIALNTENVHNGQSRTVDINELSEYLSCSVRNTYRILAELERFEFIMPKSTKTGRQYELPAFPNHEDTDNTK